MTATEAVTRRGPGRTVVAALALTWGEARWPALAVAVLTAFLGLLPAGTAYLVKLLFDELARGGDADPRRVLLLAVASALGGGLATVTASVIGYVGRVVQAAVTVATGDRLAAAVGALRGLRSFEDPRHLDRIRLAEQGASEAPQAVTGLVQEVVRVGIVMAGFAGVVVVIWPPMMLLLVGALVPAVLSQLLLGRLRARVAERTAPTKRRYQLFRSLVADGRAAKETRLYGLAGLFRARTTAALREATYVELRAERVVLAAAIGVALVSAVVSVVAVAVAAIRCVHGELSLGDVTLFTAAVAALQASVVGLVGQFGPAGASLLLFGHFLDLEDGAADLPDGSDHPAPLRTGVELRDVWFRYDEDGPWVLRGVNLAIPYGQAVGLVGVNGAGKSTLVKLLCRFYDPQHGEIRWDGTDIRRFDLAELRARVGATFQDYMNYDLTAAENVGLGDVARLGDRDRIRAAARLADVDDRLAALPRGYDTLLSRFFADRDATSGACLSGGQWQRVALARSLVRTGTDLLILDEPSSGLDAEAEHRVHATLRAHRQGRTSVLISHRLATLRDADRIVVLHDGRVAEEGGHAELMAAAGEYARLFRLQSRGYADAGDPDAGGRGAGDAGAGDAGAGDAGAGPRVPEEVVA